MRFAITTLTILLLTVTAAGALDKGMHGSVRYDYIDFQGEGDAQPDVEASSFTQQYSLLYTTGNLLSGGRAGYYSLSLGAEYSTYDNSIDGVDDSVSTFKPLYSGDVVVAPGGLPFRLHLFCYDLQETALTYDSGVRSELLRPEVVTNVRNGTNRTTGATLLLGIKNGSYLGIYRDTLSKFPRLLIDYRETEVDSSEGNYDIHYATRDLAFVSLNKKDNWFHYRVKQHRDYLEPSGINDRETRTYMLGTIDPTLNRAWINLTNWIKISADGAFTQERVGLGGQQNRSEEYALNFFARARRATGAASTYGTYSRERANGELDQRLSLPVYFNRTVNRDVGYSGEVAYRNSSDEDAGGMALRERENFYTRVRVETRRTQRYILAPELAAEAANNTDGNATAVRAKVELLSNARYKSPTDIRLRYVLSRFDGEYADDPVDYLENELYGRVVRRVGKTWRYGGEEKLVVGNGDMTGIPTSRIRPSATLAQFNAVSSNLEQSGTLLRSLTTFFVYENTKVYENRLQVNVDYLQDDSDDSLQTELTHLFEYGRGRVISYTMENKLSQGDNQTRVQGDLGGTELDAGVGGGADVVFRHESKLKYMPNRILDTQLRGGVLSKRGTWDSDQIFFGESVRYNVYRINGVVRRVLQLSQDFNYELVDRNGRQESYYSLGASARYNPVYFLTLYASGKYESRPERERDLITNRAGIRLDFPKFDVNINYARMERAVGAASTESNRTEQQLWASVEKIF